MNAQNLRVDIFLPSMQSSGITKISAGNIHEKRAEIPGSDKIYAKAIVLVDAKNIFNSYWNTCSSERDWQDLPATILARWWLRLLVPAQHQNLLYLHPPHWSTTKGISTSEQRNDKNFRTDAGFFNWWCVYKWLLEILGQSSRDVCSPSPLSITSYSCRPGASLPNHKLLFHSIQVSLRYYRSEIKSCINSYSLIRLHKSGVST